MEIYRQTDLKDLKQILTRFYNSLEKKEQRLQNRHEKLDTIIFNRTKHANKHIDQIEKELAKIQKENTSLKIKNEALKKEMERLKDINIEKMLNFNYKE